MSHVSEPPFTGGMGDDDAVDRMLRVAGPRPIVSAERAARVRAAVHREWRAGVRQRTARRRTFVIAALSTAAALLVFVLGKTWRQAASPAPLGEVVAVVQHIEGAPRRAGGQEAVRSRGHLWSPNDPVRVGDWVETDATARAALRLADGTSVRVDTSSRVRTISSRALELAAGAVYVDTGEGLAGFEVRTPLGTARDVGTQFEVRVSDAVLRLRVRTGVVQLRSRGQSLSARAGMEVALDETGAASRPLAIHGEEWQWAVGLAPTIAIEGRTLDSVLTEMAREHGWTLQYADRALAREASGIVLHGSVKGLSPHDVLDVAVRTSGLSHRLRNGDLLVFRPAERH
jgi:hypothetical protein